MKVVKGFIKMYIIFALIILFTPLTCLAGEQGYLIIKDIETFLDMENNTPFTSQQKIWITDNKVRVENSQDKNRLLLILMDKNEIYHVDVSEKTYRKWGIPDRLKDLQEAMETKSEKLNKTKKFGEWDCYGIKISIKSKDVYLEAECWLTQQVDIPYTLRLKVAKYFGLDLQKLTEELTKYEGYPVYVTLTMKTKDKEIKINNQVMEVKKLEIEEKNFEIPADFKLIDLGLKPEQEAIKNPNIKQEKIDEPLDSSKK